MIPRFLTAALLVSCQACTDDPIRWDEIAPLASSMQQPSALWVDAGGRVFERPAPMAAVPPAPGQCFQSIRSTRDSKGEWYATWWRLRADSTADLVMSRSSDGVAWDSARKVDTTDAGRTGCQRPPPAIAADGGNVYVVYAMTAHEGPGIFASHSMDHGMIFHTPVTVVYGERPGATSVAARGDLVAIAYEDPNTTPQRIGLAVSRTMGHSYEHRELVSAAIAGAREPRVAVNEKRIAVAWLQGAEGGGGGRRGGSALPSIGPDSMTEAARPTSRSRVLIADDDPTCVLILEHVLEALGRTFDVADDGEAAWSAWEQSRHSLVLLDIEMPGMDGLEVCRRIKKADPIGETFIVVVTGRDKVADLEEVLDAGADDYIAKPLNGQHLLARLRIAQRHMQADASRREVEEELRKARWLAGIGETSVALQHEINNPLTGLLATAELMVLEARDKGESTEELGVIIEQGRRIVELVKGMGALRNPKSVPYAGKSRMIDLKAGGVGGEKTE